MLQYQRRIQLIPANSGGTGAGTETLQRAGHTLLETCIALAERRAPEPARYKGKTKRHHGIVILLWLFGQRDGCDSYDSKVPYIGVTKNESAGASAVHHFVGGPHHSYNVPRTPYIGYLCADLELPKVVSHKGHRGCVLHYSLLCQPPGNCGGHGKQHVRTLEQLCIFVGGVWHMVFQNIYFLHRRKTLAAACARKNDINIRSLYN